MVATVITVLAPILRVITTVHGTMDPVLQTLMHIITQTRTEVTITATPLAVHTITTGRAEQIILHHPDLVKVEMDKGRTPASKNPRRYNVDLKKFLHTYLPYRLSVYILIS